MAAEVAGVPGHVEDGDIDADARDVLREGAEEEEEGRQSPHRRQRQRATTDSHAALCNPSFPSVQVPCEVVNVVIANKLSHDRSLHWSV